MSKGCSFVKVALAPFTHCRLSVKPRSNHRNMSQHVATGWPNVNSMVRPTMLRYVVMKCCDGLAGACKCSANNVGICCFEM